MTADDLVLRALRLAEFAHRNRPEGPHFRKAPDGGDRPAYFIHLAEVAWMLQDAGLDDETVAAGYLHDIIEDCGYTQEQLAQEIGNAHVAAFVACVSETKERPDGSEISWEERNRSYRERLAREAPPQVLALSCADKTANMMDMCRHLKNGHPLESFTSRGHKQQLEKFEALGELFLGQVPEKLWRRYELVLSEFRRYGLKE